MRGMKNLVVGILAHVDAGKTTLSESMLYLSGSIRKLGRVDHQDAFLDTYDLERSRGITIFSKQAVFTLGGCRITLLDTPGHVDFCAEMERTLQVVGLRDFGHQWGSWSPRTYADAVAASARYKIPVFLFVNKMDQDGTDREKLMEELKRKLDGGCVDFSQENQAWMEELAMCDERLLEEYLENGGLPVEEIPGLVKTDRFFPAILGRR